MSKWAAIVTDAVRIIESQTLDAETGLKCIITPCADHQELRLLPSAVVFEGRLYGRTGWNSDRHVAYYRTDAPIAMACAD